MNTAIGLASKDGEYEKVEESCLHKYSESVHAVHCMVFSRTDEIVMGSFEAKAIVLMQMRFDGHLGFPGGVVDSEEEPLEALRREMREEVGFREEDGQGIKCMFHHYSKDKDLLLSLYCLEVGEDDVKRLEQHALNAPDYGDEVLGTIRVPLYTMGDGYRGLPAFLQNKFIGNSKQQLLDSLVNNMILSPEEVTAAVTAKPVYPTQTLDHSINKDTPIPQTSEEVVTT